MGESLVEVCGARELLEGLPIEVIARIGLLPEAKVIHLIQLFISKVVVLTALTVRVIVLLNHLQLLIFLPVLTRVLLPGLIIVEGKMLLALAGRISCYPVQVNIHQALSLLAGFNNVHSRELATELPLLLLSVIWFVVIFIFTSGEGFGFLVTFCGPSCMQLEPISFLVLTLGSPSYTRGPADLLCDFVQLLLIDEEGVEH